MIGKNEAQVDETTYEAGNGPSAKLEAIRKRNSILGTRRCIICNAVLSETNPSKNLCRAHMGRFTEKNLSRISTRAVPNDIGPDDMDFDK